jgi:phospholipase C
LRMCCKRSMLLALVKGLLTITIAITAKAHRATPTDITMIVVFL